MTNRTSAMRKTLAESVCSASVEPPGGLTSDEASSRLKKLGLNTMPDISIRPLRGALEKFWTPVPWMLEAAIMLESVLGKYVEAAIIAAVLVLNAVRGCFRRAAPTLP